MKKRGIILMAAVCLLCGVLLFNVTTVSAAQTSGTCGDDITWTFDGETGTLTFSGTGWMSYPLPAPPSFEEDPLYFTNVDPVAPWADIRGSIKKIVVSEGIKNLYEKAFTDCYNVTEVSLPSTLIEIGEKVFYGCRSLRSVTIPEGTRYIGYLAFATSGLESAVLPGSLISYDMHVFDRCTQLTDVVISEGIQWLVPYTFRNCTALKNVTLPETMTTIEYAFVGCTSLESITLPEGLVRIENAFENCTSLKSIHLPGGVSVIGKKAFRNCTALTDVTMPGAMTIEEEAFYGCTSLESVTIPQGVTDIGVNAFVGCEKLAHVSLPDNMVSIYPGAFDGTALYNDPANWEGDLFYLGNYLISIRDKATLEEAYIREGITVITADMFRDCRNLKKVTISDTVTTIEDYAFYDCRNLTEVILPDSITTIGENAFAYCTMLREVDLPENLTSLGGYAFYWCTGLERIHIPAKVSVLEDYAFYGCSSLVEAKVDGVVSFGHRVFMTCEALTEFTFPETTTTIGDDVLWGCESLQKVTFLSHNIETMGARVFTHCYSLHTITLPEGLTTIPVGTFDECYALETLVIPENVTTIGAAAFNYCKSLKSIYISEKITDIADDFSGCYSLTGIWVAEDNAVYCSDEFGVLYNKNKTKIIAFPAGYEGAYVIPDSITSMTSGMFKKSKITSITIPGSIKSIPGSAFSDCSLLETVILSEGLTTIDNRAFSSSGIKSITIPASVTTIGTYAFERCSALTAICVAEDNPNFASDENGVLYNKDKTVLICFPGGYKGTFEIPEHVESLEERAFAYHENLTGVTIPGTLKEISKEAFAYAESLENITIMEGVTYIRYRSFYACTSLRKVILPDSVFIINSWAFSDCENLEEIYILGPECSVDTGSVGTLGPAEKTVVYSYPDSSSHRYALKHKQAFVSLADYVDFTINHSVDLTNELAINYMVKADQLEGYGDFTCTMEVVIPVYKGNYYSLTKRVKLQPVLKGDYYYFTLSGITAVQMNDEVSATMTVAVGLQRIVSQTDKYSIATYAYSQLGKSKASQGLKTMCADLLRYGAAAQSYKGYRTNALADSAMTQAHKEYLTNPDTVVFNDCNKTLEDIQDPTVTWAGKTLSLDSRVTIRYVIDLSAYTGKKEDLNLVVTYTDSQGEVVTTRISELAVFREDKNWYAFDFAELRGAELRTVLSAAVYEGDVRVSSTIEYSVDTYCSGRTGTLRELCKAMMAYSDSAKAFFTK